MNIKLENYLPKKLTPKQAMLKLASYCAYQERCHQEVIAKLNEVGVYGLDAQEILLELITQNYVNEERFAQTYARGKFKHKGWGKQKIILALKQKGISAYCINKAMQEIDAQNYQESITELAQKKWATLADKLPFMKQQKTAKYLIGKGFEANLVWDIVKTLG